MSDRIIITQTPGCLTLSFHQAPTSDISLPVSLMSLMWSLMDEFRAEKPEVGLREERA